MLVHFFEYIAGIICNVICRVMSDCIYCRVMSKCSYLNRLIILISRDLRTNFKANGRDCILIRTLNYQYYKQLYDLQPVICRQHFTSVFSFSDWQFRIGNALVVVVVARKRSTQSFYDVFIVNLAVSSSI